MNWNDIFNKTGWSHRPQQALLGQAICDAIDKKHSLVAEAPVGVGKSLAIAIPLIDKIKSEKKAGRIYRGIISTETLTLQNQIYLKDLPFLEKTYGGFTFAKLMGRSNYLCLNYFKEQSIGNPEAAKHYRKLDASRDRLKSGERSEVEKILGESLSNHAWRMMTSSTEFCTDNKCTTDGCWAARARSKALASDIVVINHAILALDMEMKTDPLADGMLGIYNYLAVDEAHMLQPVLVKTWTREIRDYEIFNGASDVRKAMDEVRKFPKFNKPDMEERRVRAYDIYSKCYATIQGVMEELNKASGPNADWDNSTHVINMKQGFFTGKLLELVTEYETFVPPNLDFVTNELKAISEYLTKALSMMIEKKIKGVRKVAKGARVARETADTLEILSKAMYTKDGIVSHFGTYGILMDGRIGSPLYGSKNESTIRIVPLDIATKASKIWGKDGAQTNILLSGTLTDMTDGSFRYARACVGFPTSAKEIKTGSAFDLQKQQLVYISPGDTKLAGMDGARYSLSEMLELIHAAKGRTLMLFTARRELDWVASQLRMLQNAGQFPYTLLVQDKDSNKDVLAEQFKNDTHSVLLGSKSFFTGFDVPGEALSLVIIAKFPLPQFNDECKQQIHVWRTRGFPKWYEREALTVFQQASGRGVRSVQDRAVIAIMDHRANNVKENVYKTIKMGVDSLQSPVTQSVDVVKNFLEVT